MANCECLAGCLFFNDKMADMLVTANIYKKDFCQGDNSRCARYMVFKALGKSKVPANLFPNNLTQAKKVIAQG